MNPVQPYSCAHKQMQRSPMRRASISKRLDWDLRWSTRTSMAINGGQSECRPSLTSILHSSLYHCLPPLTWRDKTTTPRSIMCASHSFMPQLLLLAVMLMLVYPPCRADCSSSPPSSQAVLTTSIGAGSTSTIASITCPSGQTAVNTYWNVQSSDGTSPFTFVIRDGGGARNTVGPTTCTYTPGGETTLSSYATMSASVTCNNPTHFFGIGNKNCPISFNVGFLCTPFPPANFQGCQVDSANCPATSTVWYYSPAGGTNVINQFCCADGTTAIVDNTANTCHCGPVVLSSTGYQYSTYWIAPNATSVWIPAPSVTGGGSGQYSSTISPSLSGTGLSLLSSGAIISSTTGASSLTAHPLTAYTVTMADTYNTGVAAVTIPINIAIQVETFSWARTTTGDCSVTCGGGSQTVDYECADQSGAVVDNSQCSPATRPPSTVPCNTQACSGSWVQTSTGTCSALCGGGVQSVEYACENAQGMVMPVDDCPSPPSATSVACNTAACQLPWAGTYTADDGCAQSHCCCAVAPSPSPTRALVSPSTRLGWRVNVEDRRRALLPSLIPRPTRSLPHAVAKQRP